MDEILEERILLDGDADIEEVENALDEAGIDYDWDSGDRLMVSSEDLDDVTDILDAITGHDALECI